ncbi:SNF2 family N-terminal domain-containing protein [Xylaria curta]|nr:SNF2 family N-terminal domain-containing protein [Xylaria curta]
MPRQKRTASSGLIGSQPDGKVARRDGNDFMPASDHYSIARGSILSSILSQHTPPSSIDPSSQLDPGASSLEDDFNDADETNTPEDPPLELYGTIDNKIVGVRYYDGIVTPGESILCTREPHNAYDSNAVRVDNIMGSQIGHLPRVFVQKIAPYLDSGEIILDGVLNGHKRQFDCPVRLNLYGTSIPAARLQLEAKLKADRLLKATELKNTRKEAEAERAIAKQAKNDTPALGLGSSSQQPIEVLSDSEEVDFRADPSALDVLNMDEATLSAMPQAAQPDTIKSNLLFHQLQGLAWMKSKEDPQLPAPKSSDIVQLWKRTSGDNFQNLASGHITSTPPRLLSGGILTDEMGLGKTLQTISLIMSDGFQKGPTLIVAPTGVLSNWEQQFTEHVKTDQLPRVFRFHGSAKLHKLKKADILQYDVVITSYGVVASQFKSGNWTALFGVEWNRVVLDEGHVIRNPNTKNAQAACKLQAKSRWILSGTPFVNNAMDFWSALLFLKITGGIQEKAIFNSRIARPLEGIVKDKNNKARLKIRGEAQAMFQALVQDLCLRRKKDMAFINLQMPDKTEYVHRVRFTKLEQLKYEEMLTEAREILQQFISRSYSGGRKRKQKRSENGEKGVGFANVLETLLRLRQMCDHWSLTGSRVKEILAKLGKDELVALTPENAQILLEALAEAIRISEDCPICYDPIQTHDPVITACKHRFGKSCILNALKRQERCPMCRQDVTADDLLEPQTEVESPTGADVDSDRRSSKTDQLEILVEKHLRDPASKVVIFSQWTSFLNIIEALLVEKKIKCVRLEGKMNIKQRDEAVEKLNNDPETRVMLASLHAAGVGVNLTAADTVILTDCWWAPAIEDQAVDRVHRIGQKRPVTVYKLLVEGSVEYRVLDIQSEKRKLVALAFQDEDSIRKEEGAVTNIRHLLYGSDEPSS